MEFWPFLDLQPAEHERGTGHWLWLSSHIHRNKNLEISFLFFLKVPGNKDLFTSASTSAFPATFVFLCASTTCQSDIPLTVYQHTPGKQTDAFTSMRATGEATQMPYLIPVWQWRLNHLVMLSAKSLSSPSLVFSPIFQWRLKHGSARRLTPARIL